MAPQQQKPGTAVATLDYFLHGTLHEARTVLEAATAVLRVRDASETAGPAGDAASASEDTGEAPKETDDEPPESWGIASGGANPAERPPPPKAGEPPPPPPPEAARRPPDAAAPTPAPWAPGAKLTTAQVREIRRTYRPNENTAALVKQYNVTATTILNIVNRITWTDLAPEPGEYMPPAADAGAAGRPARKAAGPGKEQKPPEREPQPRPLPRAAARPAGPGSGRRAGSQRGPKPRRPGPTGAKLTEAQVLAIRATYRPGHDLKALAAANNVSETTIQSIINRTSWKHLPPVPGEHAGVAGAPRPPASARPAGNKIRPAPPAAAKPAAPPQGGRRRTGATTDTPPEIAREIARLTPESINSIRSQYKASGAVSRIARHFGISIDTVRAIGLSHTRSQRS